MIGVASGVIKLYRVNQIKHRLLRSGQVWLLTCFMQSLAKISVAYSFYMTLAVLDP